MSAAATDSAPPDSIYILSSRLSGAAARTSTSTLTDSGSQHVEQDKESHLVNEQDKERDHEKMAAVFQKHFPSTQICILPVSLDTQVEVVADLAEKQRKGEKLAVLQLCDGIETDGYPGNLSPR